MRWLMLLAADVGNGRGRKPVLEDAAVEVLADHPVDHEAERPLFDAIIVDEGDSSKWSRTIR